KTTSVCFSNSLSIFPSFSYKSMNQLVFDSFASYISKYPTIYSGTNIRNIVSNKATTLGRSLRFCPIFLSLFFAVN
ncbi:MAG: hypothetical protein PHC83_00875, partial [Bacteroidales bacterium]|nr:hypothetical protein [Bacteroidales bacterium]